VTLFGNNNILAKIGTIVCNNCLFAGNFLGKTGPGCKLYLAKRFFVGCRGIGENFYSRTKNQGYRLVTFSPPCLTAEGGASPNCFEEISCFIGRYSRCPKNKSYSNIHVSIPPQAVYTLLTPHGELYKKHSCLYYQTKLVLRIDGFMHKQSFSMQPHTNSWLGTVPRVCTVHLVKLVRLCQSSQWLADMTMIAYV
jgi:hypothetical protein